MKNWILVGLGGFIGTLLRYGIGSGLNQLVKADFPWPTFIINVLGCFMIGYLFQVWHTSLHFEWIKPFLLIGFLGGFTTFSSFALEGIQLIEKANIGTAMVYIFSSNIIGLGAAYWGTVTQFRL